MSLTADKLETEQYNFEGLANRIDTVGHDSRPILGKSIHEIAPTSLAEIWHEAAEQALDAGERVTVQSSHDDRHYDTILVLVDVRGEDDSYQLIARDISSRVERERELKQTTEQLELIDRFVRHDIPNDINLVYAWAEMLENGAAADEYAEATFERNYEVPDIEVRANGILSSVFRNLLNNAVQHNNSPEPEVRLSVQVNDEAGTATVIIADNGPGVPERQRAAIFGKGDQGTESSGTGIGLYLVHTLVSQYGGTVWVEDRYLGGAAFCVELPLAAE